MRVIENHWKGPYKEHVCVCDLCVCEAHFFWVLTTSILIHGRKSPLFSSFKSVEFVHTLVGMKRNKWNKS